MNKKLLKSEMDAKNVTVLTLCKVVGISSASYYRKCNGSSEFTFAEIQTIKAYLSLSPEKVTSIFFDPEVS